MSLENQLFFADGLDDGAARTFAAAAGASFRSRRPSLTNCSPMTTLRGARVRPGPPDAAHMMISHPRNGSQRTMGRASAAPLIGSLSLPSSRPTTP